MKIIDSLLYLETSDLLEAGVAMNTIKKASYRKNNSLPSIKDTDDARKLLFDYKKISKKRQELVTQTFGDPFEYVSKQPIKDLVSLDTKAHQFYTGYRYGDNNENALSAEQINAFTKAASYLNVIIKCTDDNSFVKKELGMPVLKFY